MAVWHLERHSVQQARKYFGHLVTLRHDDADVWLCLSVYCAMTEEFDECNTASTRATVLIKEGGRAGTIALAVRAYLCTSADVKYHARRVGTFPHAIPYITTSLSPN